MSSSRHRERRFGKRARPQARARASRAFLGLLAGQGVAQADAGGGTPSLFLPVAEPAQSILDYGTLLVLICAVIFVVVMGLLALTVVRFRASAVDDGEEPPQIYGSDQLELAWTVVPVLIVIVLGLITAGRIVALQKDTPPAGSLAVRVVGHQWWWELEYPDHGFVTANELHLPLGQVAFLELESEDVIHSFWLPQLSGKLDVIPNRTNTMWIEPQKTGMFVGQCAEYCGTQHANMLLRVFVHAPEDFERWVRDQQQEARRVAAHAEGRALFATTACVNCHTVRGLSEIGSFGPDLTHLMSRTTLAAGAAVNDEARLVDWLTDPDHIKPGARMPAMKLSDAQIARLAGYLSSLE
ncbi:MAG TPA: cytochrome c oxidase subunit II [Myxococcales bacterium]|nr:cytochrome c oxidase subunit II [Myxococcales bacterium]